MIGAPFLAPRRAELRPLDTLTAAVGYSTRLLRAAYSGDCVRVRRDSDNAEQDIGFVNGWLDEASLVTFLGGANAFVAVWYDQSINANHQRQVTSSLQPELVYNPVLDTWALEAPGGDRYLLLDAPVSVISCAGIVRIINQTSESLAVFGGSQDVSSELFVRQDASTVSFDGKGSASGAYAKNGGVLSGFDTNHDISPAETNQWYGQFSAPFDLYNTISRPGLARTGKPTKTPEIIWFDAALTSSQRDLIAAFQTHAFGINTKLPDANGFKHVRPGA